MIMLAMRMPMRGAVVSGSIAGKQICLRPGPGVGAQRLGPGGRR